MTIITTYEFRSDRLGKFRSALMLLRCPLTLRKVWTVSLPLVILNSPAVSDPGFGGSNPKFGTSRDIAGIVLWTIGWLIETIGDIQKVRPRGRLMNQPLILNYHSTVTSPRTLREMSPSQLRLFFTLIRHLTIRNTQKGLWRWSRHPPYFGEYVV